MAFLKVKNRSTVAYELRTKRIEKKILNEGWSLDMHSTFLSRKTSFHKVAGKKRFVKIKNLK